MGIVTFKDLCLDAVDAGTLGRWWAPVLGLSVETWDDDPDVALRGPTPQHTLWVNTVPEPKTVKNRVHLDVRATSLDPFADLDRWPDAEGEIWTTYLDPEGNEFCVFTYDEVPTQLLKDVVVDAVDHRAIAEWWAEVFGATAEHTDPEYSNLDDVPGWPYESFDFGSVPEPKTVKNRIHWDVTLVPGASVDDLTARGATILREPLDDEPWTVMADPEGNEFCVFP